jgi:hypothetical protein
VKSERAHNPDILALPEATVAIVHKQAEECLAGTVVLATAADSRATTLTGIFGGTAVALLAAGATVLATPEHKSCLPLLVAAPVSALFLYLGCASVRLRVPRNRLFCCWL